MDIFSTTLFQITSIQSKTISFELKIKVSSDKVKESFPLIVSQMARLISFLDRFTRQHLMCPLCKRLPSSLTIANSEPLPLIHLSPSNVNTISWFMFRRWFPGTVCQNGFPVTWISGIWLFFNLCLEDPLLSVCAKCLMQSYLIGGALHQHLMSCQRHLVTYYGLKKSCPLKWGWESGQRPSLAERQKQKRKHHPRIKNGWCQDLYHSKNESDTNGVFGWTDQLSTNQLFGHSQYHSKTQVLYCQDWLQTKRCFFGLFYYFLFLVVLFERKLLF